MADPVADALTAARRAQRGLHRARDILDRPEKQSPTSTAARAPSEASSWASNPVATGIRSRRENWDR